MDTYCPSGGLDNNRMPSWTFMNPKGVLTGSSGYAGYERIPSCQYLLWSYQKKEPRSDGACAATKPFNSGAANTLPPVPLIDIYIETCTFAQGLELTRHPSGRTEKVPLSLKLLKFQDLIMATPLSKVCCHVRSAFKNNVLVSTLSSNRFSKLLGHSPMS